MFRAMMDLLMQMLERDFRFFHRGSLGLSVIDSTRNRQAAQKRLNRQRIPMSTAPLVCHVCKKSKSPNSGMIAELIRPSLLEFIKKKVPDLDSKAFICFEDLGEFRKDTSRKSWKMRSASFPRSIRKS